MSGRGTLGIKNGRGQAKKFISFAGGAEYGANAIRGVPMRGESPFRHGVSPLEGSRLRGAVSGGVRNPGSGDPRVIPATGTGVGVSSRGSSSEGPQSGVPAGWSDLGEGPRNVENLFDVERPTAKGKKVFSSTNASTFKHWDTCMGKRERSL